MDNRVVIYFLSCYGLFLLLGLLSLPLTCLVFKKNHFLAVGLAKIIGLVTFSLLVWLFSYFARIELKDSLWGAILGIEGVVFSLVLISKRDFFVKIWPLLLREVLIAEGVFLVSLLLTLTLKAYNPEIYWGEKPMDFTFFNYFSRLQFLPAEDPWAAGHKLHYYYLGSFLWAQLLKFVNIPTNYGYNFALCSSYSLQILGFYAVFKALTRRSLISIGGAFLLCFLANFDLLKLWLIDKKPIGFDLFWASSRTLQSPGFNEYPLWSFLFGDLHAHYLSLPFTLIIIAAVAYLLIRDKLPENLIAGLIGLTLGYLLETNAWDFLGYTLLVTISFALLFVRKLLTKTLTFNYFGQLLKAGVVLLLGFLFSALPFFEMFGHGLGRNISLAWGFLTSEEYNTPLQIFLTVGHWLLLLIIPLLLTFLKSPKPRLGTILSFIFSFLPVIILFTLEQEAKPWITVVLYSTISFLSFSVAINSAKRVKCFAGLIVGVGAIVAAFIEFVFLESRMNTAFKFNHLIWTLFGIGAVLFGSNLITKKSSKGDKLAVKQGYLLISSFIVFVCLIAGVVDFSCLTVFHRVNGPRPVLDGTAYLAIKDPAEKELIDWINKKIVGTPVVVEAFGPSYGEYTRISMNTGLPTIIGWGYHVEQRGVQKEEIKKRKRVVDTIYQSENNKLREEALRAYNVSYLVVGKLEQDIYGRENTFARLSQEPVLEKIYDRQGVALYQVKNLSAALALE